MVKINQASFVLTVMSSCHRHFVPLKFLTNFSIHCRDVSEALSSTSSPSSVSSRYKAPRFIEDSEEEDAKYVEPVTWPEAWLPVGSIPPKVCRQLYTEDPRVIQKREELEKLNLHYPEKVFKLVARDTDIDWTSFPDPYAALFQLHENGPLIVELKTHARAKLFEILNQRDYSQHSAVEALSPQQPQPKQTLKQNSATQTEHEQILPQQHSYPLRSQSSRSSESLRRVVSFYY